MTDRPPFVACRCGRIYYETQNAELWACLRRHMVEDDVRSAAQRALTR